MLANWKLIPLTFIAFPAISWAGCNAIWNGSGATWSPGTNWNACGGQYPGQTDPTDIANFNGSPPTGVTLNVNPSILQLSFLSNNYTLTGAANNLTIGGPPPTGQNIRSQGLFTQIINAPIFISATPFSIGVISNSTIEFQKHVTESGPLANVNVTGAGIGSGNVNITNNTTGLDIAGTLTINSTTGDDIQVNNLNNLPIVAGTGSLINADTTININFRANRANAALTQTNQNTVSGANTFGARMTSKIINQSGVSTHSNAGAISAGGVGVGIFMPNASSIYRINTINANDLLSLFNSGTVSGPLTQTIGTALLLPGANSDFFISTGFVAENSGAIGQNGIGVSVDVSRVIRITGDVALTNTAAGALTPTALNNGPIGVLFRAGGSLANLNHALTATNAAAITGVNSPSTNGVFISSSVSNMSGGQLQLTNTGAVSVQSTGVNFQTNSSFTQNGTSSSLFRNQGLISNGGIGVQVTVPTFNQNSGTVSLLNENTVSSTGIGARITSSAFNQKGNVTVSNTQAISSGGTGSVIFMPTAGSTYNLDSLLLSLTNSGGVGGPAAATLGAGLLLTGAGSDLNIDGTGLRALNSGAITQNGIGVSVDVTRDITTTAPVILTNSNSLTASAVNGPLGILFRSTGGELNIGAFFNATNSATISGVNSPSTSAILVSAPTIDLTGSSINVRNNGAVSVQSTGVNFQAPTSLIFNSPGISFFTNSGVITNGGTGVQISTPSFLQLAGGLLLENLQNITTGSVGVRFTTSDVSENDSIRLTNSGNNSSGGIGVLVELPNPNSNYSILTNRTVIQNTGIIGDPTLATVGSALLITGAASDLDIGGTGLTIQNSGTINQNGTGDKVQVSRDISITGNANVTMTNTGTINASAVNGPVGISFQSTGGTLNIGGSNFSAINNATISGVNSPTTYGVLIQAPTANLTSGNFSLNNSGAISVAAGGVSFQATGPFTMSAGIANLNNFATITNGGVGAEMSVGSFTETGGNFALNNSGSLDATSIGSVLRSATTVDIAGGSFTNNTFVFLGTNVNVTGAGFVSGVGTFAGSASTPALLTPFNQFNNHGTVSPGNPLGVLRIVANQYNQFADGTLVINIKSTGAPGPTTFSQLNVTGTANLAGTLDVIVDPNFTFQPGDSFIILHASVLRNGTFSTVITPPGFTPSVVYDPNDVILTLQFIPFNPPPPPPPSNVCPCPRLCDSIGNFGQTIITSITDTNNFFIKRKLQRIQERVPGKQSEQRDIYFGNKQHLLNNKPNLNNEIQEENVQLPPGIAYFDVLASNGTSHEDDNQVGFDFWSTGAILGADYAIEQGGAGALVNYEYIKGDGDDDWGNFHTNRAHASVYGTYLPSYVENLAVDGMIGAGYDWYTFDRNVGSRSAKGSPNGSEFDATLSFEYNYMYQEYRIIPMANLQYVHLHINEYDEDGAGIFNFDYDDQSIRSLSTILGLWADRTWQVNQNPLTAQVNIGWQHEFQNKGRTLHYDVACAPCNENCLRLEGAQRNNLLAGLNLLYAIGKRFSVEGSYDLIWNSKFHRNGYYLGVNSKF